MLPTEMVLKIVSDVAAQDSHPIAATYGFLLWNATIIFWTNIYSAEHSITIVYPIVFSNNVQVSL